MVTRPATFVSDQHARQTEVLIFGNPQGGTHFIKCNPTVGIDLPATIHDPRLDLACRTAELPA
ncbi:MAG: DUF302 domain-containing protein [Chthoniobacteraceae bacterium]